MQVCLLRCLLTLSVPTLWNTSPVPGGADLPPLNYGYWRMFSLFFLARVLNSDVKGQNLKAQQSKYKKYRKAEYVQCRVPSGNVHVLFVFEVVLIVEVHLNS